LDERVIDMNNKMFWVDFSLSSVLRSFGRKLRHNEGPIDDFDFFIDTTKDRVIFRILIGDKQIGIDNEPPINTTNWT